MIKRADTRKTPSKHWQRQRSWRGKGGTILITGNVKLENAGEVNLSGIAVQRGGEIIKARCLQ